MNEEQELQNLIGSHYLDPKHYGKIENADGVGIGIDKATNQYVVMTLSLNKTHILDVKYSTNSTQDAHTLASLFIEMIKGDEISSALENSKNLEKDLDQSYANIPEPKVDLTKPEGEQVEHISTEYQDAANIVLTSFRAAFRHYERAQEGIEEEHFEMGITKSCPYSGTECNLVQSVN